MLAARLHACERIVAESPDRVERRRRGGNQPDPGAMIWFLEDYRDDVVLVVRVQHLGLSTT